MFVQGCRPGSGSRLYRVSDNAHRCCRARALGLGNGYIPAPNKPVDKAVRVRYTEVTTAKPLLFAGACVRGVAGVVLTGAGRGRMAWMAERALLSIRPEEVRR